MTSQMWPSGGKGCVTGKKASGTAVVVVTTTSINFRVGQFSQREGGVVFHGEETRDVTKPAEIHFREIWISDLTSV